MKKVFGEGASIMFEGQEEDNLKYTGADEDEALSPKLLQQNTLKQIDIDDYFLKHGAKDETMNDSNEYDTFPMGSVKNSNNIGGYKSN